MKLPPLVVGHNHAVLGVKPEGSEEVTLMALKLTITTDPTDPTRETTLEIAFQPQTAELLGHELVRRAQQLLLLQQAQRHGKH